MPPVPMPPLRPAPKPDSPSPPCCGTAATSEVPRVGRDEERHREREHDRDDGDALAGHHPAGAPRDTRCVRGTKYPHRCRSSLESSASRIRKPIAAKHEPDPRHRMAWHRAGHGEHDQQRDAGERAVAADHGEQVDERGDQTEQRAQREPDRHGRVDRRDAHRRGVVQGGQVGPDVVPRRRAAAGTRAPRAGARTSRSATAPAARRRSRSGPPSPAGCAAAARPGR